MSNILLQDLNNQMNTLQAEKKKLEQILGEKKLLCEERPTNTKSDEQVFKPDTANFGDR